MDNARSSILRRLHKALRQAPFEEKARPVGTRPVEPSPDPQRDWEVMGTSLERVGGRLHLARTPHEAVELLHGLIEEHHICSAARWRHDVLEALGIDGVLLADGVEIVTMDEAPLCPNLANVDLGITAVDAAFALAGTLVVMAAPGRPRAASLVPPLHVAFVPQSLLYTDLASLPGLLRQRLQEQGRLPSAVHMITGSSSTADIEQTLVRPAHGPAFVHAVGLTWL